MGASGTESKHSQPGRFGTTVAVRRVRRFPGRLAGGVGVAGLVALGLMSAPAPAASDGHARALGRVTAVAWNVRTPVGARLVLRPFVTLNLQQLELRALEARK